MVVKVEVEYCGTCGYAAKFNEMKEILETQAPVDTSIIGVEGRRASFEVKINDKLIHSKLSTLAFPDYQDVSNIVTQVAAGHEVPEKCKQQPITSCNLM